MSTKVAVQQLKKPSKGYTDFMKILRTCCSIIGLDVVDPNYRINYRTWFVFFAIGMYFTFTGMTVAKLFHDDWKVLLEATCMAGSVLQGTAKLITGICRAKDMSDLSFAILAIYEKYEQNGAQYVDTLHQNIIQLRRIIVVIGKGYLFSCVMMILTPLVMYAWNGSRVLIMHFHLPGFGIDTDLGYIATNCAHAFCIFVGGFGLFSGEVFTISYLMQCFMFADIFNLKVQTLNEMVDRQYETQAKKPVESHVDEKQVNEALTDIIEWHQLYTKYTTECNNLYFYIITVQVGASAIAIVLTIFIMLTSSWPAAYPYILLTVYNLYVYCILGSIIDGCNDRFTYEIYNISWYCMSVSQRRMVRLMLMQSQSPATVQVAGILPLSVSTGLQITKTIYTITMMMIQFFVE